VALSLLCSYIVRMVFLELLVHVCLLAWAFAYCQFENASLILSGFKLLLFVVDISARFHLLWDIQYASH